MPIQTKPHIPAGGLFALAEEDPPMPWDDAITQQDLRRQEREERHRARVVGSVKALLFLACLLATCWVWLH